MASDQYTYTIQDESNGITIRLLQVSTGKDKLFYLAGTFTEAAVDSVSRHMDSLTDDLCSQWFNERQPKAKKAK